MQANTDTISPSMTFKEAMDKLREIADEHGTDYFRCAYSATESGGKLFNVNCELYYHNGGLFSGRTWEEAFDNLDKKINPPKLSLDGAPE